MGEGVAVRGLRPLWRLRRQGHIGSLCDVLELRAPCHARLLARSGAAAFGDRWYYACYAILSSRAVQSRASARSQDLDATCVSRKTYVVHGDAAFCAERKIPINIAGTADKVTRGFREQKEQ